MSTFFNTIHITNFKSLKDVTLSDCKRINLLIGKPNVGKSNILEAIGLFGVPHFIPEKFDNLNMFTRLENISELFFNGDIDENIEVVVKKESGLYDIFERWDGETTENKPTPIFNEIYYILQYNKSDYKGLTGNIYLEQKKDVYSFSVDSELRIKEEVKNNFNFYDVKPYLFQRKINALSKNEKYLIPPYGANIFDVIKNNKQLKEDLLSIFSEYGLKLVFDKASQDLKIMKQTEEDIFLLPYSSIADTLQRVIFFKTAIASNKDSIILFEEPEAHCFPPYIRHITQEIINSESNQFFIATHSPYVLNDFLEYQRDDVAIFMADFKDGQTVIKRLTDSEVNDVYEYGIDLFFNSELFTDEI